MPTARVHVIPTLGPDDTSGLQARIAAGDIDPGALVAIMGKTEGNGCVNDFTRALAVTSLRQFLGQAADGVAMVMSGGTEGALSPHLVTFERLETEGGSDEMSLALGAAITPEIAPQEIGTFAQIASVADGVRAAVNDARIARNEDVHFVQVKCPLLTRSRIAASSHATATNDSLKSMSLSRGASALGCGTGSGRDL